jgi:hypothetical protein
MRGLEPLTSSVQGRRSPSELHPQLAISYWLLAVGAFLQKLITSSQQLITNWWAFLDLNQRPFPYQRNALAD